MTRIYLCLITLGAVCITSGCSGKSGGAAGAEAQATFERACVSCHSADVVFSKTKTQGEWRATVARMRVKGAPVSQEDVEKVATWLFNRPQK